VPPLKVGFSYKKTHATSHEFHIAYKNDALLRHRIPKKN